MTTIGDLLNAKFGDKDTICRCHECESARTFKLMDDLHAAYGCRTVPEVLAVMRRRERMDA